jgi:hypothetical protein
MDNKKRKPENDNLDDPLVKKPRLEQQELWIILLLVRGPSKYCPMKLDKLGASFQKPIAGSVDYQYTYYPWPPDEGYISRAYICQQVKESCFAGSEFFRSLCC